MRALNYIKKNYIPYNDINKINNKIVDEDKHNYNYYYNLYCKDIDNIINNYSFDKLYELFEKNNYKLNFSYLKNILNMKDYNNFIDKLNDKLNFKNNNHYNLNYYDIKYNNTDYNTKLKKLIENYFNDNFNKEEVIQEIYELYITNEFKNNNKFKNNKYLLNINLIKLIINDNKKLNNFMNDLNEEILYHIELILKNIYDYIDNYSKEDLEYDLEYQEREACGSNAPSEIFDFDKKFKKDFYKFLNLINKNFIKKYYELLQNFYDKKDIFNKFYKIIIKKYILSQNYYYLYKYYDSDTIKEFNKQILNIFKKELYDKLFKKYYYDKSKYFIKMSITQEELKNILSEKDYNNFINHKIMKHFYNSIDNLKKIYNNDEIIKIITDYLK